MNATRKLVDFCMVGSLLLAAGCEVIGVPCDGITALLCGESLYCQYDEGVCGDGDQSGVCAERPEACALIYAPVCGCDGRTYGNACEAAGAGINIRRQGTCPVDGDAICGGIAGLPCDEGEYCQTNIGECCCDFLGVCIAIPEVCTEEFAPVCGCDAVTYDNGCFAARAAASIDHEGECAR